MRFERIRTADESETLRDTVLDVTYRSIYGARTESEHVFVRPAMAVPATERRIFEFGLGTGCNLEQTLAAWDGPLVYWAVDWSPLPAEYFDPQSASGALIRAALENIGNNTVVEVSRNNVTFILEVCPCLGSTCPEDFAAHAIFHDPFGPDANPEGWSEATFAWEAARLAPKGILATYSAAGKVRRAMAAAGLTVATRPGPGHKREVTVAARLPEALSVIPDAKILGKYHG